MKPLSTPAAAILARFIDRLGDREYLDFPLAGYPDLRLTRGRRLITAQGGGYVYDIGVIVDKHQDRYQYLLQCIVIDNPVTATEENFLTVFPIAFRDDVNQVSEDTCLIVAGLVMEARRSQYHLATHADNWILQLRTDGYANRAKD